MKSDVHLVLNVGCQVEFKAILPKIYIVMLVFNSIDINQITNDKWNDLFGAGCWISSILFHDIHTNPDLRSEHEVILMALGLQF